MCDKTHRAFHLELVKLDLHLLLSLFILDQLAQVSEKIVVEHKRADKDQLAQISGQIMAERWKTSTREKYLIKLSSFSSLILL